MTCSSEGDLKSRNNLVRSKEHYECKGKLMEEDICESCYYVFSAALFNNVIRQCGTEVACVILQIIAGRLRCVILCIHFLSSSILQSSQSLLPTNNATDVRDHVRQSSKRRRSYLKFLSCRSTWIPQVSNWPLLLDHIPDIWLIVDGGYLDRVVSLTLELMSSFNPLVLGLQTI